MKIALLISGGVDSSVALALLKEQGYDITAYYLKIWLEEELSFLGDCPWEEDIQYISKVCEQFSVPLEIIPLQREYHDRVVSYTIDELKQGRTPSPDLFCNQRIKFGAFYDKVGYKYPKIATGHYARTEDHDDYTFLKTAPDPIKDQTYFLAHLNQQQIQRALFPIGALTKTQVREFAQKYDLPNKDRKDSQGICFLGKIKFRDFTAYHLGDEPGDIKEWETQKVLGRHRGYWFHTIGQRKGLGLSGGPWYVVKKDVQNNIIYVSRDKNAQQESKSTFHVANFNWITRPPITTQQLKVKVRHGKEFYHCSLSIEEDNTGIVRLDGTDQGIAAGQFAVFYQDDICLGCASIQ
ncbi:tRNA 2-thiouridine(34) synthase MnmA [Candidatus Uabimicrobium amorphum]|uniref:tRNA-specific 2-thiouridylase MnmA n=1 Tax=Uabimicrobium amorphum TaxID=2596890 RepID=A0A5S9F2C1_UABAM|nr:tRNA 2-thiouridine(34) synthase MnmA [Candidatus Uabimicrobium amorphum]BBM82234.1 tRNA-specific 2-thiouridylase MnmA [Candidatus Uabimicrobium amorphum]